MPRKIERFEDRDMHRRARGVPIYNERREPRAYRLVRATRRLIRRIGRGGESLPRRTPRPSDDIRRTSAGV